MSYVVIATTAEHNELHHMAHIKILSISQLPQAGTIRKQGYTIFLLPVCQNKHGVAATGNNLLKLFTTEILCEYAVCEFKITIISMAF